MKVLVVGATGVLGRPSVMALVRAGYEVSGLARSPTKAAAVRDAGATPVEFDLFDAASARAAVDGHDAVIHMATHIPALSRASLPGAWSENDRLRREGTRVLVDAALAAGAGTFVKESVSFGYRDSGDAWIDEEAPIDPVPILASAMAAEEQSRHFAEQGGRGVVLRFGYFYGPEAESTHDTVRLARRRISSVMGRPDAWYSVIHTDDAAAAVVSALTIASGTYNVDDDEPLTRRHHLDALTTAFALQRPPRLLPATLLRVGGSKAAMVMRSQRVSNRRFREAASWAPRHPSAREGWKAIAEAWSGTAAAAR